MAYTYLEPKAQSHLLADSHTHGSLTWRQPITTKDNVGFSVLSGWFGTLAGQDEPDLQSSNQRLTALPLNHSLLKLF